MHPDRLLHRVKAHPHGCAFFCPLFDIMAMKFVQDVTSRDYFSEPPINNTTSHMTYPYIYNGLIHI